ncbi:hypothetical protein KA093_00940 [Candidatus Saccharibacteria bacterium]|nr:hypothetical protein [Candidatus Saccharibacteria bacterium]
MDSAIILMFAGVVVVGLILIAMMAVGRKGRTTLNKVAYQKEWLTIEGSVTKDPSSQQFAVLQADKLLDKALRESGYAGQTMGERLTSASRVFSRREAVWAAHKLRNRVAHEDTVRINPDLTRKALGSFKRALKDIGAI